MTNKKLAIESAYQLAKEYYASFDVDTDRVIKELAKTQISLQCWQGDDVGGFLNEGDNKGGVMATGNYPGRARNADELRSDIAMAAKLIPAKKRINLHAIYAEIDGKKVERNDLSPQHFSRWLDWGLSNNFLLDFNPTFFSHPLAASGFTLSHRDNKIRSFWIEHAIACREIASYFGKKQGSPSINNVWIPDGMKDMPANRLAPRERLVDSLDKIFKKPISEKLVIDVVEGKLFGIGFESYVVGSYDFYLGYAISRKKGLCLDMGHFHPTESIADKISSLAIILPHLLLHVSRGVRWDSDHVVVLNDDLKAVAEEVVRCNLLNTNKLFLALDFFDATINRVAAWVIGARALVKALLIAMLEPQKIIKDAENQEDYTKRLAMLEMVKVLPFGAVWDYFCERQGVPLDSQWLDEVRSYEKTVLSKRV